MQSLWLAIIRRLCTKICCRKIFAKTLKTKNRWLGLQRAGVSPVGVQTKSMSLTIWKMTIMAIWNRNLATIQDRRILIMRQEFRRSSVQVTRVERWLKIKAFSAPKLPDISQLSKILGPEMRQESPFMRRLLNFRRLRPMLSRKRWIAKNFCNAIRRASDSRCSIRAVEWISKCRSFSNKYSSSPNSSKATIQS